MVMVKTLEKQRVKLEEEKRRLILKEKLIKEAEKKKRIRGFSLIGKLAYKANIDLLDQETLLGAFLELSERVKDASDIEKWRSRAAQFLNVEASKNSKALSVIFLTEPTEEHKNFMRQLGFKWNRIRKEYLGHSSKDILEKMLVGISIKISEV